METMAQHVYQVYLETYVGVLEAFDACSEARLRDICSRTAAREGADSLVALMALSDAERGRGQRGRMEILQALWRHLDD